MVIVAVLAAIALPSYQSHLIKSARVQTQTEMLELAGIQEKIYLNSNAYSASVTSGYDGTAAGGLGRTTGASKDNNYRFSLSLGAAAQSFVLTATPQSDTRQALDGALTISETGQKLWLKPSGTVGW